MGYCLEDMIRDSGVSSEQIEAGVQAMDEEARAYRLREARCAKNERRKRWPAKPASPNPASV